MQLCGLVYNYFESATVPHIIAIWPHYHQENVHCASKSSPFLFWWLLG